MFQSVTCACFDLWLMLTPLSDLMRFPPLLLLSAISANVCYSADAATRQQQ